MSIAATVTSTPAANGVRSLLRLEALALFCLVLGLYARESGNWLLFAKLFLVPDVSIAFYLFGQRVGAAAYNAVHSTLGPLMLAGFAVTAGQHLALTVSLIWLAHVGFDRALGYGLKYASGFSDTHLGRIGRKQ
jgi:hypothetical protein